MPLSLPPKKNKLLFREWIALSLFTGFLFLLLFTAEASQKKSKQILSEHLPLSEKWIEIEVIGEVANPGIYLCHPGTTVKEFLKQVPLTKQANRKKIRMKKVFYSSQSLVIPAKKRVEELQ